jgi:hypothetical protein
MFLMLVGMLLAFAFVALPLAIFWLFIMSIVDQSNKRSVDEPRESSSPARHIFSVAPD